MMENQSPTVTIDSADNKHGAFDLALDQVNLDIGDPVELHLAHPNSVQPLQKRQYDRVRVNITGVANTADDESTPCVVLDISIGGALIELNASQGTVNDPLRLILRVEINGSQFELALDSKIRSVRLGESGANILQGLAFNDLSEQDILALAAFDLFPD